MARDYEHAEIAVGVSTDLYSRLSMRELDNGQLTRYTDEGEARTENLSYEVIRVKLTKDIKGSFYLIFQVEAAREQDIGGVAFEIQDYFHHLTRNMKNLKVASIFNTGDRAF